MSSLARKRKKNVIHKEINLFTLHHHCIMIFVLYFPIPQEKIVQLEARDEMTTPKLLLAVLKWIQDYFLNIFHFKIMKKKKNFLLKSLIYSRLRLNEKASFVIDRKSSNFGLPYTACFYQVICFELYKIPL